MGYCMSMSDASFQVSTENVGHFLAHLWRYPYDYTFDAEGNITEIEYTPKRDSLVRLSTYSNLCFDGEAQSPLFDFQIPADAKHTNVDPAKLFGH